MMIDDDNTINPLEMTEQEKALCESLAESARPCRLKWKLCSTMNHPELPPFFVVTGRDSTGATLDPSKLLDALAFAFKEMGEAGASVKLHPRNDKSSWMDRSTIRALAELPPVEGAIASTIFGEAFNYAISGKNVESPQEILSPQDQQRMLNEELLTGTFPFIRTAGFPDSLAGSKASIGSGYLVGGPDTTTSGLANIRLAMQKVMKKLRVESDPARITSRGVWISDDTFAQMLEAEPVILKHAIQEAFAPSPAIKR